MERVENLEIEAKNGKYVISFGHNRNVLKIVPKLSGKCADIKVEYAQNGIVSELVLLDEMSWDGNNEIFFKPGLPIAASHLYISVSGDAELLDAEIFEIPDVDSAECYPAVRDIDLGKNYYLDTVTVFTPTEGYTQYTVYTSMNGRDFEELARKTSKDKCDPEVGEVYNACGKEARIIRVFIEYNSDDVRAVLDDVRFTGRESETEVQGRPQICVEKFEDSEFNVGITKEDTYDEVYGIIERRVGGGYTSWFTLELAENPKGNGCDYFELSDASGRIRVKGSTGVALAVGINYYLKYFCNVNISQVGDQTKMPTVPVKIGAPIFRETPAKLRYAYNYCTLSYSMAFWGEEEWRYELDWLALSGVNLVLDLTAQEEVWRRFLGSLGYSRDEIKRYIAGPAYYAWAYMANLSGFGGPVHDSWFEERTHLARKNQLIMRKLGMRPVLQGYSGMVPSDITVHDPNCEIIRQGMWCSFKRPDMLKTTSQTFRKYAERFYQAQREVYGDVGGFYAIDPFHEGGITAGLSEREVAREVLSAMCCADPDAIWVIQSWQGNPKSELLAGLEDVEDGRAHALVIDLYGEKTPHYNDGCEGNPSYGYRSEFDNTPWIFGIINNFGGRLGMHGFLDNIAREIPNVFKSCKHVAGIGIVPEATYNNPVVYDFFFESVWQKAADDVGEINIDEWLMGYSRRRYGKKSKSAEDAWSILKNTVYRAECNQLGQGAPESVVNARPELSLNAASTWGNSVISYEKGELKRAAALLLEDYDNLKESDGYIYDVVTVLQQVLSNEAQDIHKNMAEAFESGDVAGFEKYAKEFLDVADMMDMVTGANQYYMLGRWVNQARRLAENADDFTKRLYEMNAKALITTWGSYNQSEIGLLHDYSNRQWSGLISDFYKPRWEKWIKARLSELRGDAYEKDIDWFSWEWEWVRKDTSYPDEPEMVELNKLRIC